MLKRDYVFHNQQSYFLQKKNNIEKRKRQNSAILATIFSIIVAIVLIFISILHVIAAHKKETSEVTQKNKVIRNILPPKPRERWKYIKELEKRQPNILTLTRLSTDHIMKNKNRLFNNERQKLLGNIRNEKPTDLGRRVQIKKKQKNFVIQFKQLKIMQQTQLLHQIAIQSYQNQSLLKNILTLNKNDISITTNIHVTHNKKAVQQKKLNK